MAIALGSAAPVFAAGPSTQPIQSKLLDPKPTKDDKSKLQLNLPKGWVPKKDIKDTGFESPTKDQAGAISLSPNVILNETDAADIKPTDIDELLAAKRKQYVKIFKGFKEVDPTPAAKAIPGKGVGVIEFTYTPAANAVIHGRQIWIVDTGKIYIVTWTSLNETYSKNQKIFAASMNTLVVP
ncbi:MAG TPA: hypothetical protein VL282_12920 [Tepidisphaeraceae bacterium]|nr:hypothetical protein [Tepidisphaeraceae bacterium]